MKVLLILIVSMALIQGCKTSNGTTGGVNSSQAEEIAKRTFLKSVENAADFELKTRGEDNEYWHFIFAPRKRVRTGDVIVVGVDKKKGTTKIHYSY